MTDREKFIILLNDEDMNYIAKRQDLLAMYDKARTHRLGTVKPTVKEMKEVIDILLKYGDITKTEEIIKKLFNHFWKKYQVSIEEMRRLVKAEDAEVWQEVKKGFGVKSITSSTISSMPTEKQKEGKFMCPNCDSTEVSDMRGKTDQFDFSCHECAFKWKEDPLGIYSEASDWAIAFVKNHYIKRTDVIKRLEEIAKVDYRHGIRDVLDKYIKELKK